MVPLRGSLAGRSPGSVVLRKAEQSSVLYLLELMAFEDVEQVEEADEESESRQL